MKKKMLLMIKGKTEVFCFKVSVEEDRLIGLWGEGIRIYPIKSVIPEWVYRIRAHRIFLFFQNVFNFRNPFNAAKF